MLVLLFHLTIGREQFDDVFSFRLLQLSLDASLKWKKGFFCQNRNKAREARTAHANHQPWGLKEQSVYCKYDSKEAYTEEKNTRSFLSPFLQFNRFLMTHAGSLYSTLYRLEIPTMQMKK